MLLTAKNKRNSLLFVASVTLLAPLPSLAANESQVLTNQSRSCYDVLRPELEFSDETIREMHGNLMKNKTLTYAVNTRTKLDAEGKATSVEFLLKDPIEELNDVAQTIAEVAAVKCADPTVSEVTQRFVFTLTYVPGEKRGTVRAKPMFYRYIVPVGPAPENKRYCHVAKRDENGIATDVSCDYDGFCVPVKMAQPEYPRDELNGGRSGAVTVTQTLDRNGRFVSGFASTSSGNQNLDNASIKAAKSSTYSCSGNNPLLTSDVEYTFTASN